MTPEQRKLFEEQNPITMVCSNCGKDSGGRCAQPQQWDCDKCEFSNNEDLRFPTAPPPPDPDADLAGIVAAFRKADSLEALKAAVEDAWVLRRARQTGEKLADVEARVASKVEAAQAEEAQP